MSDRAIDALTATFQRQLLRAGADAPGAPRVAELGARLMRLTLDGHTAMPVEAALGSVLEAHPWVGSGAGSSPLVWEHGQLYLRRYRDAEARLAAAVVERAKSGAERLQIITGGPGTGKTSSVAEIMATLLGANPSLRVALAAPTGKAASRMNEAIHEAWKRMKREDLIASVEVEGKTLHRLLGYLPTSDTFRRHATDPLEADVVIVDEASMVPLLLMDALFQAVRPDARLILLGDHDQLASVEAGSVLADLVHAGEVGALGASLTRLTKSFRFDDTRGIGKLARAIRSGDADAAIASLAANDREARYLASPASAAWMDEVVGPIADAMFGAESADLALKRFEEMRVLCATNVGPAGSLAMTSKIEERLRRRGHSVSGVHYRGRPFLVTRNDYALGVFNGDVGIVWDAEMEDGREPMAVVASRSLPLPQLPDAVTAWAMSVHKSQGSEFDAVVLVLPERDHDVLNRELLYTAVTRARKTVLIVGPEDVLRTAIARTARRVSGLAARLGAPHVLRTGLPSS